MAPLDSGSVHGHTPVPARATSFILLLCGLALLLPARASAQDLTADELERRAIEIFERSCTMTGCHGGPIAQQNMFLTSSQYYESIVDQPSVGRPDLKRVDPGKSNRKVIEALIKGGAMDCFSANRREWSTRCMC